MKEDAGRLHKRMEALEYHAWKCLENAENNREKLAAVKTVSDLLMAQLRIEKNVSETEVENDSIYAEQLQELAHRVRQLASRRGERGQETGS